MKIELIRRPRKGFTEGDIKVNDKFECYSVEDEDRKLESGGKKIQNFTAIPRGIYNVTITYSNRFKKRMPLVENVKGFTGIRIHSGNKSADTEGCIIVGGINTSYEDDFVGASKIAYEKLFKRIDEALMYKETVTLEIK